MSQAQPKPSDDLIRLADLEWLDLSDLIRMDEEWRQTLLTISRLHLALLLILTILVVGYTAQQGALATTSQMLPVVAAILSIIGIAILVFSARNSPTGLVSNLRFVVLLSILAVSCLVFLLRDLQGDYYLLFFLPLVSAAGYLGFTGGLLAGIVSAIAYAIVFVLSPVSVAPGSLSALVLRILVFVLVPSLLGLISERHLSLLSALRASHKQAIQFAVKDSKTGLFNVGYLQSRLRSEISRAERSKTPVAFLVLDIKGLARINEEYGFDAGDAVLENIGKIVQKQLRVTDIPSRWGADEIGLFLFNSDAQGAELVAGRIAADLASQSITDPNTGRAFKVSATMGIAAWPQHTQDPTGRELVDRAYAALQRAQAAHPIVVWST